MNYDELLNEIELQLVKKSLEIDPELVPTITKIMVTPEIWSELSKDRMFKVCIARKPIYRNIEKKIKKQWIREWIKVSPEPNLGGIPLEQGDHIEVYVEGKSPVKRIFKKDIHTATYS